jgi:hypothetical protein
MSPSVFTLSRTINELCRMASTQPWSQSFARMLRFDVQPEIQFGCTASMDIDSHVATTPARHATRVRCLYSAHEVEMAWSFFVRLRFPFIRL